MTGGSSVANVFHRAALRMRSLIVLPRNNLSFGWPSIGGTLLAESHVPLPNMPAGKHLEILASAYARYNRKAMEALVPDAAYFTILRDPVKHFQSSWVYWHITEHIRDASKNGSTVTMEMFLGNVDLYWPLLSTDDINVLHNSMAFDLGLTSQVLLWLAHDRC